MGLVDDPVANRREQSPIGYEIAEEQAMVGYHDIGRLGAAASSVNEAQGAEERAFPPKAIGARCGDGVARQSAIVDFQTVDIIVLALLDEGEQSRKRGRLHDVLTGHITRFGSCDDDAVYLSEAGVMGKPLKGGVIDAARYRFALFGRFGRVLL